MSNQVKKTRDKQSIVETIHGVFYLITEFIHFLLK